jgi:MoaA/NifB/PqqE/SkfB family radical SAM enzyme
MSLEQFMTISEKLRRYGSYIGFISGGEPTLVPYLDKILMEAKKTFMLTTTLVTGLYNNTKTIQKIGQIALENNINIQTSLDALGSLADDLRGAKNHANTVLNHMDWLSKHRGKSKSLLYANIVINNQNLEQIPELIRRIRDLGWKTTIGLYHTLTGTTRYDKKLTLKPGKRLDNLLTFLNQNREILNLNSFIQGIGDFIKNKRVNFCAFVDAPTLTTRTTILENGDIHLCYGEPIGNIFDQTLEETFTSQRYQDRLHEYRSCKGCWTTCYTQRYLLIHPRSVKELMQNIQRIRDLKKKTHLSLKDKNGI